jgi:hypothetical protein
MYGEDDDEDLMMTTAELYPTNTPVYRDGKVHVCAEMCATCVFRPGNRMKLQPGRVRGMVDQARADGSAITCHATLHGEQAVCRGFFERHPTPPLQIAERLDMIVYVEPPTEEKP